MKDILYSLVYNIYPMKEHGRPEHSNLFNDQCFHCPMGIGTCSPILRLLVRLLYVITYDLLGLWYHCSPLLWCCLNQLGAFLYFGNNMTPCDWMTLVFRWPIYFWSYWSIECYQCIFIYSLFLQFNRWQECLNLIFKIFLNIFKKCSMGKSCENTIIGLQVVAQQ